MQKLSSTKHAKPISLVVDTMTDSIKIGKRIPKDYFITSGSGESNITVHAGSYHLALKDAGIEQCNIMTYSSILPAIATEVEKPDDLVHGSVMETIMAVGHTTKGKRTSAGIIFGWLFDKKTGQKYGGLVCENNGEMTEDEIKDKLHASLNELYTNGFDDTYDLKDINIITKSIVAQKEFASALVAICFTSHIVPVIG